MQFIPIVEFKGFETTAPHAWDAARLPMVGSPQARPAIRIPSSPTGRSIPTTGDISFARSSTSGAARMSARCWSTISRRWSPSTSGCRRSSASTASSAARAWPSSTTAASTPATTTSIRSIGSATSRNSRSATWCSRRTQVKFGYAKCETLPRVLPAMRVPHDCWGECPKNRLLRTPDGEPGLNYLCPGLKRFFAHAVPTAEKMAARLRATPPTPQRRM